MSGSCFTRSLTSPRSSPHGCERHGCVSGHTLVELLFVLVVAGTLATLAVPSFRELSADARRDARVAELRGTLLLARAEAVARGRTVRVCASSNAGECAADGAWSSGWAARVDDGPVIALTGRDAATSVLASRTSLDFQPSGIAASTATLTVCDARGARAARALVVSRTGRVRTVGANGLHCG
jgi:type IV fimbrial biogenesis protein FimT